MKIDVLFIIALTAILVALALISKEDWWIFLSFNIGWIGHIFYDYMKKRKEKLTQDRLEKAISGFCSTGVWQRS